jgi:hypothetical protein
MPDLAGELVGCTDEKSLKSRKLYAQICVCIMGVA